MTRNFDPQIFLNYNRIQNKETLRLIVKNQFLGYLYKKKLQTESEQICSFYSEQLINTLTSHEYLWSVAFHSHCQTFVYSYEPR